MKVTRFIFVGSRLATWLACLIGLFSGCSSTPYRPCSEGGQAAREDTTPPFRGIKRCRQLPNRDGKYLNHGKYFEWYSNDRIALQGEYDMGKKTGKWIEYDTSGQKISTKYYQQGKEVPEE